MTSTDWQKSSYCGEGSGCVELAATSGAAVRLRESDAPQTTLTTTPAALRSLLHRISEMGSAAP